MTAEHDESSDDESVDDDTSDETSDGGLDQEKTPTSVPETSSHDVSLDAAERGGAGSDVRAPGSARKPKLKPSSSVGELDVPAAVPEMSELMEIQMMARSQAIGGTKGAWSETKNGARDESGKTRRSRARSGGESSDRNTSGGETSATSGGESEGFDATPRGAWSDGESGATVFSSDEPPPTRRRSRDVRRTASDAATGGDAPPGAVRRRRHRRPSDAAAEFASAVAVDPGERRALKLYDRRRRDSGSRRRTDLSARERRDQEVARDAAAKALGPPRVTVEPDPDVRDEPDSVNDGVGRRLRTVLGVSATDRPGLLHDISQGLNRLRVQLLHCEASVVANRSVSIWRLQSMDQSTTREEIRTVIEALLSPTSGSQASKEKGQSVLRVRVRSGGALVGRASADVNFRATYGAAIVAMQRGGRAPDGKLGQVKLREGDVLVLQCNEDSPLLKDAPADFLEENRLDAGKDESRDESFVSVPQKGTPGGGSTPANMPSTPHGSRSSLMSMVGMKDLGMKDLRGYSLRSRGAQQSKTELDKNDANLSVGAEVSVTVEKEPPSTASSGGSSGSGSNDVSANDVSVAIPDIRGLSLRSPVAQTVTPKPAEDDADEKAAGASRLAVRKAHRDLEIIGAANDEAGKEFLIAVRVERRSQFIKKTADEAGLRQLPGLFLVSIERHKSDAAAESGSPAIPTNDAATKEETSTNEPGSLPHPVDASTMNATLVKPSVSSEVFSSTKKEDQKDDASSVTVVDPSDDKLLEDDVLWYAGNAASVSSLRKIPGLAPYSADQVDKLSNVNSQERRLIQAVVAKTGPLVGKSIREIKFRTRYNAVVLAVHREGARVHARVGDVILHPGDVLLLDAGPDFHREAGHSGSGFALVSVLEDSAPPRLRLLVPVLAIAVAMIAVYSAGVTELLVAAIFAAAIMIACGALSEQEARDAIKWDVIVTIAAAFGMSKALQNSGVAGIIAERLVSLAKVSGTGRVGLLTAVYFATFLISNVVTNNAAAALMFPIAAEAAEKAGETLQSVSFLVMLAASASFMSPFGYQTNLMVYGPGGYVFKDFLRFGVPMQVVQLVVSVAVIGIGGKFWWVSWGSTAIAFGVTCAMMMWEKSPAEYARECLRAVPAAARGRRAAAEEEPSTGSRRRV
jgi:di/tricarboxylate transporter/predicted amino acid-binding ACT domain protein